MPLVKAFHSTRTPPRMFCLLEEQRWLFFRLKFLPYCAAMSANKMGRLHVDRRGQIHDNFRVTLGIHPAVVRDFCIHRALLVVCVYFPTCPTFLLEGAESCHVFDQCFSVHFLSKVSSISIRVPLQHFLDVTTHLVEYIQGRNLCVVHMT